MEYVGSERRKDPRINCHYILHYSFLNNGIKEVDVSQLKNLSSGGLFFISGEALEQGKELSMKLRLPVSSQPIVLDGKVVESKKVVSGLLYDTRVEFSRIEDGDKQLLGKLIAEVIKTKSCVPS